MTSLGGGDWIGNSRGLSDGVRAQMREDAGRNVTLGAITRSKQNKGGTTAPNAKLKFVIAPEKTKDFRYRKEYYYQLVDSSGKPSRGRDYLVTEHTEYKSDFTVKTTEDRSGPLTRDGFFRDGVGFENPPGDNVTGNHILFQTFSLKHNGQPGPPVSTQLRHDVRVTRGEVSIGVSVVEP